MHAPQHLSPEPQQPCCCDLPATHPHALHNMQILVSPLPAKMLSKSCIFVCGMWVCGWKAMLGVGPYSHCQLLCIAQQPCALLSMHL
jgi:hypothetical protein